MAQNEASQLIAAWNTRTQTDTPDDVLEVQHELKLLDYDDLQDFDCAEDNPEGFVEVQSTQYRWGDNIIKLIQLGYPNQWDDEAFDEDKAVLEKALRQQGPTQ